MDVQKRDAFKIATNFRSCSCNGVGTHYEVVKDPQGNTPSQNDFQNNSGNCGEKRWARNMDVQKRDAFKIATTFWSCSCNALCLWK